MAFNIHITHIHENPTASQMASRMDQPKKKPAKTTAPALTLVSVPADNVINKYPVRIFNIEA